MIKSLCKLLLHWSGWTSEVTVPDRKKCVLCVAPHTSNWDFILGELHYGMRGRKANFLMKKEWFFWPLGPIFRALGGVPVYRDKKTSLTDQLAEMAVESDEFHLAITPEGTRQKSTQWRHGFYYIALKANIPIHLYALDGKDKKIICTREIKPTGNFEADYREIMDYYRPFLGRAIKPDQFALDEQTS